VNRFTKPLAAVVPLALLLTASPAAAAPGGYPYDQPGDKQFVSNTNIIQGYHPSRGNNASLEVTAPRAQADAAFTTDPIAVDGMRDAAWDAATSYSIDNSFNATMTAPVEATTSASMSALWDGPVLYLLVEVTGDSTQSDSGTPTWNTAAYAPTTDGLFVNMDVFNDQWGLETDTQGVFFLGANPALTSVTSFVNGGIPSLGSFFNPGYQDYSSRLKAFKSSGYVDGGYTYEIALQMEGWGDAYERPLVNGTTVGLEIGVYDQGQSFTYWSKTQVDAGREGSSNLPNSERVRNRDWGVITLAGKPDDATAAYSGWRADEDIRFWNSKSNPGGTGAANSGDASTVWTAESKARMVAAKNAYLALAPDAAREAKEAAVQEVCEAFAALRWADTTYPDPHDLPALQTLPNAFKFFDETKGTDGMVTTAAEWEERKQELLDLAQFYEYGYKPQLGVDYTVTLLTNSYAGTGNATVTAQIVPTNVNFAGGTPVNISIAVTMPAAVPGGQKAAVAFGGGYTANGIANIAYPSWAFDIRSDAGAWGSPNRFGTFYTLFPYARNSTSADSSILIANATAVSVYLDALELAVAANDALDAKIDPTVAVTKGFSINGKVAFVSALFDDRVKAVVNGGAGATGPANWRYNATGQEFNFTGTPYYAPGAEDVVAFGTEGPGNSYRHNRVRETELFRHFMPYGHMYDQQPGSYSYGNYSQLPFDQSLLVATFAPDRAIIIDTNLNDYNDGAVTDNMSLQIAKSAYANLGVDPTRFVKFNSGNYKSSGDPHGQASATPEGKYLSDLLYGTTTLTAEEAAFLNTDPYALPVSNGQTQSPYDYYWGGYNSITGGQSGVTGADGWFYFGYDSEVAALKASLAASSLSSSQKSTLTAKLDQATLLLNQGKKADAAAAIADGVVPSVRSLPTLLEPAQQLVLAINTSSEIRPAWASTTVYNTGDVVTYNSGVYLASYWTQNQAPGDPTGPWQQIVTGPDGVAVWTASRIFTNGDVVSYDGRQWRAQWYTRNQTPGSSSGPWLEIGAPTPGGGPAAWTASNIYENGSKVTYNGHIYEAQWWTRNQLPGAQYGPWKLIG
jgi:chitodextrinase